MSLSLYVYLFVDMQCIYLFHEHPFSEEKEKKKNPLSRGPGCECLESMIRFLWKCHISYYHRTVQIAFISLVVIKQKEQ